MNPITVSTMVYHGHSDAVAFRHLAELGVRYVEPAYIASYRPQAAAHDFFSAGRGRALQRALRRHHLQCLAVSAHMDLGGDGAAPAAAARLEFCAEAGAAILITNAAARARQQHLWRTVDTVLPRAESLGITVALENPGDPGDSVLGAAADATVLLQRFDSRFLALNYDCSNVFSFSRGTIRPEADLAAAVPYLAHLHIKDLAALPRGGWRFTPIGRGITDYRSILARVASALPEVPIGLELPLRFRRNPAWAIRLDRGSPPLTLDAIGAAILQSVHFVQETIAGVPGDSGAVEMRNHER